MDADADADADAGGCREESPWLEILADGGKACNVEMCDRVLEGKGLEHAVALGHEMGSDTEHVGDGMDDGERDASSGIVGGDKDTGDIALKVSSLNDVEINDGKGCCPSRFRCVLSRAEGKNLAAKAALCKEESMISETKWWQPEKRQNVQNYWMSRVNLTVLETLCSDGKEPQGNDPNAQKKQTN